MGTGIMSTELDKGGYLPKVRHHVTTFVRGTSDPQGIRKGYAASCTCGAVTFGGFVDRTSARDALEHGKAEA